MRQNQTNIDLKLFTIVNSGEDTSDNGIRDEENNTQQNSLAEINKELFDNIMMEMTSDSESDYYLGQVGDENSEKNVAENLEDKELKFN